MATKVGSPDITHLADGLDGQVLRPADPGFAEARKIWNGAIFKQPSLIARCMSESDVVRSVLWAREHEVEIAVRAGGHGVAGNALTDGGIVIDLSQMATVEVDPGAKTVRVGPGTLLGDLTRSCQEHGLAVPSGIVSHTGVAGLTLGGGIGWTMRRFGLTCDNLLAAGVVTAEGKRVRASEVENQDLLWGLKGGGGNFGIVTSFEFRCYELGPAVLAGPVVWRAEDAAELFSFYREFALSAPAELTTIAVIRHAPPAPWIPAELHGRPVAMIATCYAGSIADGQSAVEPLRRWGRPLVDAVGPRDFTEYHYLFDASVPHGLGYYWKSHYLKDLDPLSIQVLASRGWDVESKRSYTIMFHMGGAVREVSPESTAFEDRTAEFAPNINAVWDEPSSPQDVEWARELFDDLTPASTGKTYVNFMSHDDQSKVASSYGKAKLEQLISLKRRYDPDNVFHLNQNIPAS